MSNFWGAVHQYSESLDYKIEAPDGSSIMPADNNSGKKACWRWSKDKFLKNKERGFVVIKKTHPICGLFIPSST